jgi:asparagine synthase (glutamine-hydrolysing)
MTLDGADPDTVRAAILDRDPLPGTAGFAGELDGSLVRDVLGRYPLFHERGDPGTWSQDPTTLSEPDRLPAGHVYHPGDDSDLDTTADGIDASRVDTASGPRKVWEVPTRDPYESNRRAIDAVREAVEFSLAATPGTASGSPSQGNLTGGELPVAFSGGIDSTVLARRFTGPLYTVGFPKSHDIEAARSAAELLDRELRVVELDHGTLERAIPTVARATGRTNAMDIQIALPLYILAERVAADGFSRLALGQAADELFGGYAKVERAPEDDRVAAETVRGARDEVVATLPDQFERDRLALRAAGVEPLTPFAHDRVVSAALGLSGSQLVRDGTRKWALRRAVADRVPEAILEREKKALQYGTLAARELDRLARQAGFKRRMENHVEQYIDSRC